MAVIDDYLRYCSIAIPVLFCSIKNFDYANFIINSISVKINFWRCKIYVFNCVNHIFLLWNLDFSTNSSSKKEKIINLIKMQV